MCPPAPAPWQLENGSPQGLCWRRLICHLFSLSGLDQHLPLLPGALYSEPFSPRRLGHAEGVSRDILPWALSSVGSTPLFRAILPKAQSTLLSCMKHSLTTLAQQPFP